MSLFKSDHQPKILQLCSSIQYFLFLPAARQMLIRNNKEKFRKRFGCLPVLGKEKERLS